MLWFVAGNLIDWSGEAELHPATGDYVSESERFFSLVDFNTVGLIGRYLIYISSTLGYSILEVELYGIAFILRRTLATTLAIGTIIPLSTLP